MNNFGSPIALTSLTGENIIRSHTLTPDPETYPQLITELVTHAQNIPILVHVEQQINYTLTQATALLWAKLIKKLVSGIYTGLNIVSH